MVGAGLYGVLVAEAKLARRAIGVIGEGAPPDSTGWYGRGRPGPAIKIALLGDSSAAGYGVDRVEDTPGAQLGSSIATRADRRVHLRAFAVVGAAVFPLLVVTAFFWRLLALFGGRGEFEVFEQPPGNFGEGSLVVDC